MLVLLVDDDPTVAEDLELLLPDRFDLIWADGSQSALAVLEREDLPAVILLDLCLPPHLAPSSESEGLALLSLIRQGPAKQTPVIVLSSLPRSRMEKTCLDRGAQAYLEKPCVIEELVAHLDQLTQQAT
jgi:two-component system response regulator QseB